MISAARGRVRWNNTARPDHDAPGGAPGESCADRFSWHGQGTIAAIAIVAALVGYGFRISLAGHPAMGTGFPRT